jgi:hypothetical protein
MWSYMGRPPIAKWNNILFKVKTVAHAFDLPNRLDIIAASLGGSGDFQIDNVIDKLTLFNYHSAFSSSDAVARGRQAMLGDGKSAHIHLGVKTSRAEWLRFCPECHRDWMAAGESARWVRSHQLPSTLVCLRHEVVLRNSTVSTSLTNSLRLADFESCPDDAAPVAILTGCGQMEKLKNLAEAGRELLVEPPDRRERGEWKHQYRALIHQAGLEDGHEGYLKALLLGLERYWEGVLDTWGSASLIVRESRSPWPMRLVVPGTKRAGAPLQHLLLQQYLQHALSEGMPIGEELPTFGWRCTNPVADHADPFCVTRVERRPQLKGSMKVHVHCDCGYVYSRKMLGDGHWDKPRRLSWGHVAEKFAVNKAAEGYSAQWISTRMEVSVQVILTLIKIVGIDHKAEFGWNYRLKNERRAERKKLLPPKIKVNSAKGVAKHNWGAIDELLAETLPSIVSEIGALVPPERVTARSIARHLKQFPASVIRQFHHMPRSSMIWRAAIETSAQWRDRRKVYAVEKLMADGAIMSQAERARLLKIPGAREAFNNLKAHAPIK